MTQAQVGQVLMTARPDDRLREGRQCEHGKLGPTHATTAANQLARATRPHAKAPVTDVSTELKDSTCRSCCSQLGLDDTGEANVRLEAVFVLWITLGLRPGELRKLSWDHVDLNRGVVHVWRSASKTGDTKTPKSKRSLTLPKRAIIALQAHKARQAREQREAGQAWHDNNLVFCREDGSMYTSDALNWRFSKMTRRAGIGHWHAHEGRHTAVSITSSNGVPIQEISDTVGHKSTHVTETVYRHVIVPAIRGGAAEMDDVFSDEDDGDDYNKSPGHRGWSHSREIRRVRAAGRGPGCARRGRLATAALPSTQPGNVRNAPTACAIATVTAPSRARSRDGNGAIACTVPQRQRRQPGPAGGSGGRGPQARSSGPGKTAVSGPDQPGPRTRPSPWRLR